MTYDHSHERVAMTTSQAKVSTQTSDVGLSFALAIETKVACFTHISQVRSIKESCNVERRKHANQSKIDLSADLLDTLGVFVHVSLHHLLDWDLSRNRRVDGPSSLFNMLHVGNLSVKGASGGVLDIHCNVC